MTTTKQRKDSFSFSILFIILFSTRELGKEQFTFDPVSIQNNYLNMINISWLKKIIWVIGVLRRTVVIDWRCDNLCGSHLQSQVVVLVSWKLKNSGERFDWSVDRVAVGKCVMWLAVKTCAEMGYANRWVVKWIINKRMKMRPSKDGFRTGCRNVSQ